MADASGNLKTGKTVGNSSNGASGGSTSKALNRPIQGAGMGSAGDVNKKLDRPISSGSDAKTR